MKFIFATMLCFLGVLAATAQPDKIDYIGEGERTKTAKLTLAREDADGNIIEDVKVFAPGDIPIYCYVDLISSKPVTVELKFIAVKVAKIRPNTKIISISYKTKNGEDAVTFTGEPEGLWMVGKYRVNILLDGKERLSKTFEVREQQAKSKQPSQD